MKVRYLYNNVVVDGTVRAYIRKNLEKIDKMLDKVMGYEIDLKRDKKGLFRVEIMIQVPHELFRAEETTESIEGSVDIVTGELQQQIRRSKEKLRDLRERGARSIKKKIVLDEKARF